MSNSLRDQLMNLGFKAAPKPAPAPKLKPVSGQKPVRNKTRGKPDSRKHAEIDLAKAYALRAQREKNERIEAEQTKQEEARKRKEAQAKLEDLLRDNALNDSGAEIARHFSYGNKIKRIYVTQIQLQALNAGQLGVVQLRGRYLLVTAEILAEVEGIYPAAIALKVIPGVSGEEDSYSDPKYHVPDDLIW
ncbi:MAG: DUF2058 family protein [Xanthomonadaceae bacterium]|jgi:uncharacterized protein YaiL (DUF2058 family)|nr:DUF2058 family protein [Xanthomonadaceae bacterium]